MIVKLLTEHHLEFLSLKGGCRGSSGSTLVKMPHCWKSHAPAHMYKFVYVQSLSLVGWFMIYDCCFLLIVTCFVLNTKIIITCVLDYCYLGADQLYWIIFMNSIGTILG